MAWKDCIHFTCFRRFLVTFNALFLVLGLVIATLPVYFHIQKLLKSWPINGAIIALGVILIVVAVFGCYGTLRQHQVSLFFYMVILTLICLLTFAFSISALSISKAQQRVVLTHGWNQLSNNTKDEFQTLGNCCGLTDSSPSKDHPSCEKLPCFETSCPTCLEGLEKDSFIKFRQAYGGIALFVSLLMCVSIYLTYRYRHFKNPHAKPDQYL